MNEPAASFVDGVHVFPVRVYFEDTDAVGMVYYANYLKYAERARTEMLRDLGFAHAKYMDDGIVFTVRHCAADYVKPARLDERLEVHTRIVEVGGASLRADQVVKGEAGSLVRLGVRLACTTLSGRPARIPKELRGTLKGLCDMSRRG